VPSYFNDVYFLVLHLHFVFLLFFLSFYLFIYTSAYKKCIGHIFCYYYLCYVLEIYEGTNYCGLYVKAPTLLNLYEGHY
jgi:hypothetical protein